MIRKEIILVFIFLWILQLSSHLPTVYAEGNDGHIYTFSPHIPSSANPDLSASCGSITFNENIISKVTGQTGPGCTFTVDEAAVGEWGTTGHWSDSPPYAWGHDHFYGASGPPDQDGRPIGIALSFTCEQPAYSLDTHSLPSFVELVKEEDITTTSPVGKRYYFQVSSSATPNRNFNIKYDFAANCDLRQKIAGGNVISLELGNLTKQGYITCVGKEANINPRMATMSSSLKVSATTCSVPTSTPSPSPTPSPTVVLTPTSTATPTPTKMPCGGPCSSSNQCVQECPICFVGPNGSICAAPSPTPTPVPDCKCYGIDFNGDLTPNSSLTIIGHGKIDNPGTNPAKVLNMVYTLYKDGTETFKSEEITATGPVRQNDKDTGLPIDVYSSSWNTKFGEKGTYRVVEKINCGWKTAANNSSLAQTKTSVLGTSTSGNSGFFGNLFNFFGSIFGTSSTPEPTPTSTPTPPPFIPRKAKSLKLATCGMVTPTPFVGKGCTHIDFIVGDSTSTLSCNAEE